MLNFGWAEMIVIGVVALIVIGPEDLPDMFRQLGRFTAKLRAMSREFSRAMEQAAKDTGVKDVAKDLKTVTSSKALGLDAVKSAADKFEKWDPIKNAAKPSTAMKPLVPPPMPATPPRVTLPTIAVDDAAEAEDDLAYHDAPEDAPEPAQVTAHGPATQALYDKKAAREAVLREQAAKLKAIDDGTYVMDAAVAAEPSILSPVEAKPAKPVWKSKAKAAAAEVVPVQAADAVSGPVTVAATDKLASKPRAPRKTTKKAETP
jgi:sec-independent protein translocase protein TatB